MSIGNQDGAANPGEFLYLHFFFTNTTNETLSDAYAVLDDTQDAFVNPIDAYFSATLTHTQAALPSSTYAAEPQPRALRGGATQRAGKRWRNMGTCGRVDVWTRKKGKAKSQ